MLFDAQPAGGGVLRSGRNKCSKHAPSLYKSNDASLQGWRDSCINLVSWLISQSYHWNSNRGNRAPTVMCFCSFRCLTLSLCFLKSEFGRETFIISTAATLLKVQKRNCVESHCEKNVTFYDELIICWKNWNHLEMLSVSSNIKRASSFPLCLKKKKNLLEMTSKADSSNYACSFTHSKGSCGKKDGQNGSFPSVRVRQRCRGWGTARRPWDPQIKERSPVECRGPKEHKPLWARASITFPAN